MKSRPFQLQHALEQAKAAAKLVEKAQSLAGSLAERAQGADDAVALWLWLSRDKSEGAARAREAILRGLPGELRERIGKRWKAKGLAYRVVSV